MNRLRLPQLISAVCLPFVLAACGADAGLGGALEDAPSEAEAVGSIEQALGCSTQLAPTMTSATAPQGQVFSSGNYSSEYPEWRAFDSSTSSMWISSLKTTPAIIGYDSGAALRVTRYAITYSNGSITTRAPKDWVFEGWNGSSWVTLDTRTNQTGWPGFQRREFAVTTPGNYSKHRLRISDDNDTRAGVEVISLGNLELGGCDASGNPLWYRNLGSSGAWTQGFDMVGDPASRTYLVGATTGSVDGQPRKGVMDGYLRATDWDGKTLFTHQFGVANNATLAYGIARNWSFEELYVVGFTDGALFGEPWSGQRSLFLTKTRYTGVRQWTRLLGASDGATEGYGAAVDRNGNAFAVGHTWGNLDGNVRKASIDAFVTKYDTNGVKQWTRLLGTTNGRTWAKTAATDSGGNVYVVGRTEGSLPGNPSPGVEGGFLAKYDALGSLQWVKQLTHQGCALEFRGAAVSYLDRLYLSGSSSCSGAFVAEYDLSGTLVWERSVGGWGTRVYTDAWGYMSNDNVYLLGSGKGDLEKPGSPSTTYHGFVASFTASGTKNWLQQLAPPVGGDMLLYGMTVDSSGKPYVGGTTKGTFNGAPLLGTDDAFVLKLPKP